MSGIGGGPCPNGCSLNVVVRSTNIHNNTYGIHTQKTAAINLGTTGHANQGNNIIAFNYDLLCLEQFELWNNPGRWELLGRLSR